MATGMTGMTGTQGPQGAAGGTGLQGPTGIAGPMGRQGGPGPTGVRGATGPLGQGAIFLRAQTIYGSTADTAAAGGGAVRNRTLTTGLPPLVNSGSTTIPYLYMTTTAFINETVTYIVVPAGTYLIRAYATANDGLNSSNIRVDALTSPVGSTVYLRHVYFFGTNQHRFTPSDKRSRNGYYSAVHPRAKCWYNICEVTVNGRSSWSHRPLWSGRYYRRCGSTRKRWSVWFYRSNRFNGTRRYTRPARSARCLACSCAHPDILNDTVKRQLGQNC